MKDLVVRGLPELAVQRGQLTGSPIDGSNPLIYSSLENTVMVWDDALDAWRPPTSGDSNIWHYGSVEIYMANSNEGEDSYNIQTPGITNDAIIKLWISGDDSTADHTAEDHKYFSSILSLTAGEILPPYSFRIFIRSLYKITGTIKIRYAYIVPTVCTAPYVSIPATFTTISKELVELPTIDSNEQKFIGSFAVFDVEYNYVALSAEEAYQVDWGDGNVTIHTSGSVAEHNYSFTSVPANTTTAAGYRQAIITITPQFNSSLTSVNIGKFHSGIPMFDYRRVSAYWLSIAINSESLTSLTVRYNNNLSSPFEIIKFPLLKRVYIGKNNITSCAEMFADCSALIEFTAPYGIKNSSTFYRMFYYNRSLEHIDLDIGNSGTTLEDMFNSCFSLKKAYIHNTTSVTNLTNTFRSCSVLTDVFISDSSNVVYFDSTFMQCINLKMPPILDTSSGQNFSATFYLCLNLRKFPEYNFSNATTLYLFTNNCYNLSEIPNLSLPSCTHMGGTFQNCYTVKKVGNIYAPICLNWEDTFSGCACVNLIGTLSISSDPSVSITNIFNSCISLLETPNIDCSTTTSSLYGVVNNCSVLYRINLTGIKNDIDISYLSISATELNNIYTNLGTVSGKSITVTGNPGTSGDNPTIATSKGWTVVG